MKINVFNVKTQDTSHNSILTLGTMNATNAVKLSWPAPTKYLLLEHQQHITRHTNVTMPDQAWGTTGKIEKDEMSPDHSPTTEDITAWVIAICRGYSRAQHQDRHSHYRSSSWWSHSVHRGHSHTPCCDILHQSHFRSSTYHSSVGYWSQDHSRSHSQPSYWSLRYESSRSGSYSSRIRKVLQTDYYSSHDHTSNLGEKSESLN